MFRPYVRLVLLSGVLALNFSPVAIADASNKVATSESVLESAPANVAATEDANQGRAAKTMAAKAASNSLQSRPSFASNIWQLVLALGAIIALIFAMSFLLKRLQHGVLQQNKALKIVGAMALGQREKMVLVEVKGEEFLLGVANGQVSCLHHFNGDAQQHSAPANKQSADDFSQSLAEAIRNDS